ncbi:MAG: hypothetical protein GY856_28940 [bacterium]|nr:hypothetical protein [bacterium]
MKLPRFSLTIYVGGLLLGLGLVLLYGAVGVSSTPGFCGSCHVMNPYYESWKTSNHAEIACVECHISPGVTAEIRKKYEAMAMVVSYITGTYGTNPWAEVEDAACLQCHERRLLGGQEVFGDVLFDHRPHLSELRRGKRLQCTSCHSQIVQGSHIAVTVSTCIICHFKDQEPDTGTARCTLCHPIPDRVVDADGLRFEHGDVERFGMSCQSCHIPPQPEEGRVPRERCITCHNDPARLAEYEHGDLLHRTHVSEHKVECTNCHLEIGHVAPRHLEVARTECMTCHGSEHSPQRTLYAGLGGKGVAPRPDPMYRAGVRCEGCHTDFGDGRARTAGEVSCMSCHGPAYQKIYRTWSETLAERTSALRRRITSSANLLGSTPPPAFAAARVNLELIERGGGMHNFPYSIALLEAAHRQLNEAREAQGLRTLPPPWAATPYASPCRDCHAGVETKTGQVFERRFPHRPHVVAQGLDCQKCHLTHEERAAGGEMLHIDAGTCDSCHHGDGARECLDCHGGILERAVAAPEGDFDHSFHAVDMELACTGCHGTPPAVDARADREVCSDCH